MAEKKKFLGKVVGVSPSRILVKDKEGQELDDFFLVLGLVFNDLKGLMTFDTLFRENYEKPEANEINEHLGSHVGLSLQIERLYAGFVHEFLNFLQDNENILNSVPFRLIVKKMPAGTSNTWSEIEGIALGKKLTRNASELAHVILLIRNNVTYHYKQAGKNLHFGYLNFFDDPTKFGADKAYYSLGENQESTRFYYVDAAVQAYISSQLEKFSLANLTDVNILKTYQEKIRRIMKDMNETIFQLLNAYLKKKTS